ncbi:hypothetical protein [Aquimarina sp. AU474]|uniref:hypothetical protein n=1 Tax=Aquimarina sp. AU474 TaxID=2108529 RepID=UPI00135BF39E|nr:hypothetical protein [Aquimarina sp. AU474]
MNFQSFYNSIRFPNWKKKIFPYVFFSLALLLFGTVIYLFSRSSLETSYELNAITEGVSINTGNNSELIWFFENAKLISNQTKDSYFSGSLKFNDSTTITIKRVSLGLCAISIRNTVNTSVGTLHYDAYKKRLGKSIHIVLDSIQYRSHQGSTIVFPLNKINGFISTPSPVAQETDMNVPILREGKVSLLNTSFNKKTVYQAGEYILHTGDQFKLKERISPYYGFLTINENPCMNLNYKVAGSKGYIQSPGGLIHSAESTLLHKLQNDIFYQWLSLVFGVLVVIASLFGAVNDVKDMFK